MGSDMFSVDLKLEKLISMGSLCEIERFNLNGVELESDDFGDKYDAHPDGAEDYACGDMQFTRSEPKEEILKKYRITKEEYHQVAERLEEILSFGYCGWCV